MITPVKQLITLLFTCLACLAYAQQPDTAKLRLEHELAATAPDTGRVLVLVKLANWYVNKPGEEKADLNKAQQLLNQAQALSGQLKFNKGKGMVAIACAQAYREGGDRSLGKQYAQQAIQLLPATNYPLQRADALMEMSNYYQLEYDSQLAQKVKLYTEAVALLAHRGPPIKYADALKYLGDLHNCQERPDIALGELKKALAVYEANGHKALQDIYNLLGYVCMRVGLVQDALKYGLLSMKLAESEGDTSMTLCSIYNRLSITYKYLGDSKKCTYYLEKALVLAKKLKVLDAEYIISINLSEAYRVLGVSQKAITLLKPMLSACPAHWDEARVGIYTGLMGAYIQLKRYNDAAYYNDLMLDLISRNKLLPNTYFSAHSASAQLYMAQRNFDKARLYISKNEELAKQSGNVIQRSQVEKMYFKTDSASGNYTAAINHFQQYKRWEDSVTAKHRSFQISHLQIAYDTEKKDRDIALKSKNIELLTKKDQLQQAQLQTANITRNAVIGGILLISILLGVVYNRFKLKKRANIELEDRQQIINNKNTALEQLVTDKDRLLQDKEWLLKEVHHRVKNNLQIVMSLLNTQCAQLDSAVAMAAIQESQHRMRSISLIHEKLYQADDVSEIDMFDYISQLVNYLRESFDIDGKIEIDLLIEPIEMDVAQAVPVGLILNEAITNCIKYAFTNCSKGLIRIMLDEAADGRCLLTITDNGCGLPPGFDLSRSNSLGINLMRGLTQQLGGNLKLSDSNGLTIEVGFQLRRTLLSAGDSGMVS